MKQHAHPRTFADVSLPAIPWRRLAMLLGAVVTFMGITAR